MSAAIKPEIYASWIPTGKIFLKPEVFVSWIPTGKIGLRPFVFATIIPAPVKAEADLLRKVSTSDTAQADLSRKVTTSENISADLLRNVIDSVKASADTTRKLFAEENISVDTFRQIVHAGAIHADLFREVKRSEKIIADTSRRFGLTKVNADLFRNVIDTEKVIGDTQRTIGNSENISADLYLRIVNGETAAADTRRELKNFCSARADTLRKLAIKEKISAETKRLIANHEKISADTFLQIIANEKIIADLLFAIRDIARADTFRQSKRPEKRRADTVIRIPHILKYIVQPTLRTLNKSKAGNLNSAPASLVNTFKDYGVTAINITLSEKTLSDDFRFDIAVPVEINDYVEGFLLDYPFAFIVEETNQKDLVQSVKGRYNVDEQLYTWFKMPYGDDGDDKTDDDYPTAEAAIQEIAGDLGLTAVIKIDNFTPNNLRKGSMVTYADVLSSLFSWTSRVPQRQINVFIRGGTLFCIQRGKEDSVFDISDIPHSRPTVNKKFNRVLCYNPNNDGDNGDDDNKTPFSGDAVYSTIGAAPFNARVYVSLSYYNGLLVKEEMSMQTGQFESDGEILMRSQRSETIYSHRTFQTSGDDEPQYYLSSKENHTYAIEQNFTQGSIEHNDTTETTSYNYNTIQNEDALYLFHEQTHSETENYSESQSTMPGTKWKSDKTAERQSKDVYHFPCGNGFYAQVVYVNGIVQSANISQGAPSNRISQYMIDKTQASFSFVDLTEEEDDFNDQLQAIVDYSFPIQEDDFIEQLNEDLRWLHQKTVETITVDLTPKVINGVPDLNHIVDFTERIRLDGNEYFLVSNNISFTPRKFTQKLQLIRWY